MAEERKVPDGREPEQRLRGRGLYSRVTISVRTLNWIIAALCVLLVFCMGFGIAKGGYEISFDTLGGTPVESQTRMYGEPIEAPEAPSREGYLFDGWYQDKDGQIPWNMDQDTVSQSATLYARWKKAPAVQENGN